MIIFPTLATLISLACAVVIARDALPRPRPEKIAWAIAFAIFAVAAGAKTLSMLTEWTPALARVYYLAGAVLVVAYLALGELYLLAGNRIARFAPGAALLVSALAATVVFSASIDETRLKDDGWEALDRGSGLGILAASINATGTLVLVGGVLYSAWRFKQLGTQRQRMIGCILIAVGTTIVATGGTATRFGHEEYYYIAMAAGVSIIFAGYLQTRRPDVQSGVGSRESREIIPAVANGRNGAVVALPATRSEHRPIPPATNPANPAITFIEEQFLPLDDTALAAACHTWSAERRVAAAFTREEAHRVWALRLRLSPQGQSAFDAHTVSARLQLSELYHDVLAPGVAALDRERAVAKSL